MEVEPPCTQETLASSTRVLSGLPSGVAQVVCICASISRQHIENDLFPLCISYLLLTSPTLRERNYMLPIESDLVDFNRDPICTHSTRVHHGLDLSGHASHVHKP